MKNYTLLYIYLLVEVCVKTMADICFLLGSYVD